MPAGAEWRALIIEDRSNSLIPTSFNVRPFNDKVIATFHFDIADDAPLGKDATLQFGLYNIQDAQPNGIMFAPNLQNTMNVVFS